MTARWNVLDTQVMEAPASLRTNVTDLARVVAAQAELLHDADKRTAVLEERMGRVTPHDR